jgi:hypothetical protein
MTGPIHSQSGIDAWLWIDLDRSFPLEEIGQAFETLERREAVKALVRLAAE